MKWVSAFKVLHPKPRTWKMLNVGEFPWVLLPDCACFSALHFLPKHCGGARLSVARLTASVSSCPLLNDL